MAYIDGVVVNQETGPVLQFDSPLETGDIFWAPPERMEYWARHINNIELTTMALGAITHEKDHGELANELFGLLDLQDLLHQDVLRSGMMYGTLVANDSLEHGLLPVRPHEVSRGESAPDAIKGILMDSHFVEQWQRRDADRLYPLRIDERTLFKQVNPAFMMLREVEVETFRSDILATTLGVVQDHVSSEVYERSTIDEIAKKSAFARDAQVLFYAGALCGALNRFLDEGVLPDIDRVTELHRGVKQLEAMVAATCEFEATDADAIGDIVMSALANQYGFYTSVHPKDGPIIGVFPAGVQYGPNSIQLVHPAIQPPWQTIKYKHLKQLVMTKFDQDNGDYQYRVDRADEDTWERLTSDKTGKQWQLGALVVGKNTVISRLALSHPHALALDGFITSEIGARPGSLRYPERLDREEITGIPLQAKKLRTITAAGAIAPWVFEAIDRFYLENGNLAATVTASALGAALCGGAWAVGNAFDSSKASFSYPLSESMA